MTGLGKCSGLISLFLACTLYSTLSAGANEDGQTQTIKLEKAVLVRIDGELTAADSIARDRMFKSYAVQLEKGQTYQIDLRNVDGRGFDPCLILRDEAGKTLAEDDNSGGGVNARLVYTATQTAVFRIVVTTAPLGQAGHFTLMIGEQGAKPAQTLPVELQGGRAVMVAHLLREDLQIQNKKVRAFTCQFAKGKSYRICLESADFDAYLYLVGPGGKVLAQDDDSYGDLNSEIIYHADAAGTYGIIATSLGGEAIGLFTLTVVECEVVKLKDGKAVHEGRLGVSDLRFKGKRTRVYPVLLEGGKTYRFDLVSKDFDAYLYLLGPTGQVLAQDHDSGGNLNARIEFEIKATAIYHVNAASLNPPLDGAYVLSINEVPKKKD